MTAREFDPQAVAAAREELLRIPGVHMVNPGRRWTNGQMTDDQALIVYVRRKLPLEAISPRDRVPREIHGMPTDVIEAEHPRRRDVEDPTESELPLYDEQQYAQVRGGISGEGAGGQGTIACIGRATDTTNNNRLIVLSNHHVFAGKGSGEGASVYQPSKSCCCCGHTIGKVLRSRHTTTGEWVRRQPSQTSIDAAIALLDGGIQCLAEIQIGVGGGATDLVRGVAASAQIVSGLRVKKRGIRTGPTVGSVSTSSADYSTSDDKALAYHAQMEITPDVPAGTTSGAFRFSAPGDSGSAVMTSAGDEVIGLLWGGYPTYPAAPNRNLMVDVTLATDINAVIAALQFTVGSASAAGQVITVPAASPAPAHSPTPAPAHTRMMLDHARSEIEATAYGRVYAEVVRRHHREVGTLIRTNRRVGAIWKRYGGQAILQAVLDAVARPDAAIPAVIGSRSLVDSARRIAAVFQRYGSAALARDAAAYEHLAFALPGNSYNELLARLRKGTISSGRDLRAAITPSVTR